MVAGDLVARVVASGSDATRSWTTQAIASLAVAIEELVVERRLRTATELALHDERARATAETLGIDAGELAKGRRQQRSILSLVAPDVPGYELASHYAAARDIGGDFFELFRLERRGGPLAIVIADVTGKGLDAALLMAFARPVMHAALNGAARAGRGPGQDQPGPRRGAPRDAVHHGPVRDPGATERAAAGRQRGSRTAAAHPGDGGPVRPVGDAGVLLGAFASIDLPEVELTLRTRRHAVRLHRWGHRRHRPLAPALRRRPTRGDHRRARVAAPRPTLVAAIRDAVEAFAAGTEPADDVTMLAVGRHRTSVG